MRVPRMSSSRRPSIRRNCARSAAMKRHVVDGARRATPQRSLEGRTPRDVARIERRAGAPRSATLRASGAS
jgi:hypothetical protein